MVAAFQTLGPFQSGKIGSIKIDQSQFLELFQSISKTVKDADKDGKLLRGQLAEYLELQKDIKKSDVSNIDDKIKVL